MKLSRKPIQFALVLFLLAGLLGWSHQTARADFTCSSNNPDSTPTAWSATTWSCSGSPGATNVIISAGDVVVIDEDLNIRNLTINGSLQDDATGNILTVTGFFANTGTFTAGAGTVVFGGIGAQTFTGTAAFNNLTVVAPSILNLGTDGAGNASVSGTLVNDGIIRAVDTASPYAFGLAGAYNGAALSIVTDAGGDFGTVTVERIDSSHPFGTGTEGGLGIRTGIYWDITPSVESGTATLTLPVIVPVLVPPVENGDLRACRYVGPSTLWDCAGVGTGSNTVQRTGVTDFSEWSVGISVEPTAIELASANASTLARSQALVALGLVLLSLTVVGLAAFMLRKKNQ